MKTTYRVLAWVIAALVVAQAASEAWFASGVGKFLSEGGTLNLEDTSGPVPFVEIYGVIWHGMAGMYLIPVVSLVFLIVGFLSRNRRARTFFPRRGGACLPAGDDGHPRLGHDHSRPLPWHERAPDLRNGPGRGPPGATDDRGRSGTHPERDQAPLPAQHTL